MNILTKRGSQDNVVTYEHICDTIEDRQNIENKYITLGTVCIVLNGENGGMEVYMADSSKEWHDIMITGSDGESSASGLSIYVCAQNEVQNGKPAVSIPIEGTLYLVPSGNESGNLYDEYVYVNDAWELFGGASIDLTGYATQTWVQQQNYLTSHQDISGKANSADLATVATSGSYNDLSNKPTIPDIRINNSSIVNNGVANIPKATSSTYGVMKLGTGLAIEDNINDPSDQKVGIIFAGSNYIKQGTSTQYSIAPVRQHEAAFYGLAKAAGDTTQSQSNNAVGTYTDQAKTAIQNMLGISGDSPVESGTGVGSVQTKPYTVQYPENDSETYTQQAKGEGSFAEGINTIAIGAGSHAEGMYGTAFSDFSHVEGFHLPFYYITVTSPVTLGESGFYCTISNVDQDFIQQFNAGGYLAKEDEISGDKAIIATVIDIDQNLDNNSAKLYVETTNRIEPGTYFYCVNGAFAPNSHAEGTETFAAGSSSHAEGRYTHAFGPVSHAEGDSSEATGIASHAEGFQGTKAIGDASHAEGEGSFAMGEGTHSEGGYTRTMGMYSHSEGYATVALGEQSHAEGCGEIHYSIIDTHPSANVYGLVLGAYVREGCTVRFAENDIPDDQTYTIVNVDYTNEQITLNADPFDVGDTILIETNVAIGDAAHTEGSYTIASDDSSHAEGIATNASSEAQHVQGKYNIVDSNGTYAHIVGNGTNSTRSNAHTLDWNGNAWYAGKVTADGTPTNANDLTTKQYVDNAINGSTVSVSGTTPTITAVANTMYVCGEVSTLSFTPAATGISDIIFESGSTATVLTVPNTVKFPDWFDATALEPNMVYEISIMNGTYGAVMAWATT